MPCNSVVKSHKTAMDVEEAINAVGVGKFQAIAYLIVCLSFMYVPANIYNDLFFAHSPPHHCKAIVPDGGDNVTTTAAPQEFAHKYDSQYHKKACTRFDQETNTTETCPNDYVFDVGYTGQSIVSEMNLVCDRDYEIVFITVHGLAAILGSVIFTPFSDKYGRKALLLMSWGQMALMSIGMCLVGDVTSYWVLRFLERLYLEGAEQALFIMACEILPTKFRSTAVAGLFLFYAIGDLLLCLQAYLLSDWRQLQMAVTIGVLVLLPANFWLPETPHWLTSVGKFKEAERYFEDAARMNNIKLLNKFSLRRPKEEDSDDDHNNLDEETRIQEKFRKSIRKKREDSLKGQEAGVHTVHAHVGHFGKLCKVLSNRMLLKDAMISSYVWACSAFMYYGLTVSSFKPGKDIYVSFMLTGLSMLPAFPLTTYILKKMGRKKPLIMFLVSLGISVILMGSLPMKIGKVNLIVLHMVLKCLAKFSATACVSSIRLIVAELFPTTVRGMCVGLVAFFGLIGGGAGLYYTVLERITLNGSTIGMGGMVLVAAYLCKYLPETSHRPLPGTLVDVMESYADVLKSIVLLTANMPGGASKPPSSTGGYRMSVVAVGTEHARIISTQMTHLTDAVVNEETKLTSNSGVDPE